MHCEKLTPDNSSDDYFLPGNRLKNDYLLIGGILKGGYLTPRQQLRSYGEGSTA